MDIADGIRIADLCLKIGGTLVVGDVHIGYEEALNKQGIMMPRVQFPQMIERMKSILNGEKPERIILIGDLKHEFGTISNQEWRETLKFLDLLARYAKDIILIKGNHDKILEPITKKCQIALVDSYVQDDVLFVHGDAKPSKIPKGIKTIVIGHEHPAITLDDGMRREKFKCFLKGTYKGRTLIVLPSFFLATQGTDVLTEELLSPLLFDIDDFAAFVVADDEILPFGTIARIRRKLSR